MSLEALHEYITGEFTSIEGLEQLPATIDEDVWIRDANGVKLAGYDIVIKDSADDTLVLNTDYVLALKDGNRTILEGFDIWAGYKVINAVYADIPLFIDIKVVGGYTDRRYRPTYINVDESGTLPFGIRDLMVFADTSVDVIELTVLDAERVNDQITIASYGGQNVVVTGTGIAAVEVLDQATSFIWTGDAYIQIGGLGGGGDLGEIQMPQPKTWVDKWTGSQASVTNQWGDGIYILTGISSADSEDRTGILVIENDADVKGQLVDGILASNNHKSFEYDSTAGTFTAWLGGAETLPITRIQRWEDDPDNLPLQTIPSDPSLIKDWVTIWEDTPVETLVNSWGLGEYQLDITYSGSTAHDKVTARLSVSDLTDESVDTVFRNTAGDNGVINGYHNRSGEGSIFRASSVSPLTTPRITRIRKWEDVAGADAQMSVPVDGWEQKFKDYTNTSDVTNSWGDGYYKILLVRASDDFTLTTLIQAQASVGGSESTQGIGSTDLRVVHSTGSVFSVTGGGTTFYIGEIHKFNSLVNVLHSYVPDPRSVAQKDWVEKYSDFTNTGNVTNVWGTGRYRIVIRKSDNVITITSVIDINESTLSVITVDLHSADGNNSGARAIYNIPGNYFAAVTASGTYYIAEISRWEDSQASDAPRTVLDDGWKILWEDPTGTAVSKVLAVENGLYALELGSAAGAVYNPTMLVNNGKVLSEGSWGISGAATYTVATNTWASNTAGFYVRGIRKFTGLLRIDSQVVTNTSEGSNITNAVIDTDAGDVDCASYFTDTTQDRVVKLTNDGTNGNHLTNCPNSIEIGDGKTVTFYYNLGWRYEDVPIDVYEVAGDVQNCTSSLVKVWKMANGDMRMRYRLDPSGTGNKVIDSYPETWVGDYYPTANLVDRGANAGGTVIRRTDVSNDTYQIIDHSGSAVSQDCTFTIEGRWKTGV